MGYSDREMRAFTQIAYLDLEKDYQRYCKSHGVDKVSLAELRDTYNITKINDLVENGVVSEQQLEKWSISAICDDNDNSGFYACVIETGENEAVVGFRGSEDMMNLSNMKNDWVKADLGLLNSELTNQQAEVRNFLDENKTLLDGYDNLAMTGHSLGGNLAEYATIVSKEYGLNDNIKQCMSLDGPGFSNEFIEKYHQEIEEMSGVMSHPRWSFVGTLLNDLPGVEYGFVAVKNTDDGEKYGPATRHDTKYLDFEGDYFKKGEQDWLSKTTSIISKGADKIPTPVGNAMVSILGGVLISVAWAKETFWDEHGNLTDEGIVFILGTLGISSIVSFSVPVILGGIVTITLGFLLASFELELYIELLEKVGTFAIEKLKELYNWGKEKLAELRQFFNGVVASLREWYNKNFNAGYQYANANTEIIVDTARLRQYADQLKTINKRLLDIDRKMDRLYTKVGLQGLWDLLQADALTSYSWRLDRCINYMLETAAEFESVEGWISSN